MKKVYTTIAQWNLKVAKLTFFKADRLILNWILAAINTDFF